MEKSLSDENFRAKSMLADLSFKFKTERTVVLLKDLTSRQMVMLIFLYLETPVKYQLLNRRFYYGIFPNWFGQIHHMHIRLTEVTGLRHHDLIEFEFPTPEYIERLTTTQKLTL